MTNLRISSLLILMLPSLVLAQYRPDWNSQNFYEQLHWCRSSIVFPSAADYERKATASGKSIEAARSEAIAIIPLSELIASASCYCAIGEVAKDITYASFTSDRQKIAGYLQGAKCQDATAQAIRSMSRDRADSLRLK